MLLDRNKKRSYKLDFDSEDNLITTCLTNLKKKEGYKNIPLFSVDSGSPKYLVSLLIKSNRINGNSSKRKFVSYLRGAKKVIDIVGFDKAVDLIFKAHGISTEGYSFKFIMKLAKDEYECNIEV